MRSLFFLLLLLVGCSSPTEKLLSDIDVDFPQINILDKPVVVCEKLELSNPGGIIIRDNYLFVSNMSQGSSEFNCSCYDINGGKLVRDFLGKGKALNEMIHMAGFYEYGDSSIQFIGDGTVKTVKIDDVLDLDKELTYEKIKDINPEFGFNISNLIDSNFVVGWGQKSCHFIQKDDSTMTFGEYNKSLFPADDTDEMTFINHLVFKMQYCYNKRQNKLIGVGSFNQIYDLIDVTNGTIIANKIYCRPKLENVENPDGGVNILLKSRGMLCNIASNDDFVTTMHYNHIDNFYEVLTFDWNLNPIKRSVLYFKTHMHLQQIGYISRDLKSIYFLEISDDYESYRLLKHDL